MVNRYGDYFGARRAGSVVFGDSTGHLDKCVGLLTGQSVPILGLFRISRVVSSPDRIRGPHGPPDLRSGKNENHSIPS